MATVALPVCLDAMLVHRKQSESKPGPALYALRALATSIVEQSINSAAWFAAGSTSCQTDRTCSPAGSMEMTMSALSTQLLALATICTLLRFAVLVSV